MNFTIDAWIKGRPSPIVSNFNMSNGRGYTLAFDAGNVLRFDMGTGSPSNTMTWLGPAITPDAWTFVAVVVDRVAKKVTLYTAPVNGTLTAASPPPLIAANANAYSGLPLAIGGCPGNPNGCVTVLDEVEVFSRALSQSELQPIVNAGSVGKCVLPKKGMTWVHTASNAQNGTITVGCSGCDAYHGDTPCTTLLPLLCIYKPPTPFPPPAGMTFSQNYRWAGGVVATTPPVAGNHFAHISFVTTPPTDANSYCALQFGPGWRVAEFHDGWGWNFQAYGGTVSAPTVPSTRFWVHIKDQPSANCWQTP